MVHSSFKKIGSIDHISKDDPIKYCTAILSSFDSVLDFKNRGTIVVPTFTLSYARSGETFIYEDSKADPSLGIFPEYIRQRKESFRSLHPLLSLCALGKDKNTICGSVSKCCYGWNSPFHRLYENEAKILLIGVDFQKVSFIHHIEYMAGVSHYYNKAYFTPAWKDGTALKMPYCAGVRYYNNCVEPYFLRMQQYLNDSNLLNTGYIGNAKTMFFKVKDLYDIGFELLQENPCYFLKKPFYTTQ